jgi:hypothetical protein
MTRNDAFAIALALAAFPAAAAAQTEPPGERSAATAARETPPRADSLRVRVQTAGQTLYGRLLSPSPILLVETTGGDTIQVDPTASVRVRPTVCDTSAAAEGGAWLGMFAGIGALLFVEGGWRRAGVYSGSILLGTTGSVVLKAIDCRRWKPLR